MMQPICAAILCLLSPGLDAARLSKSDRSGHAGKVTSLHTFGAPHVSTLPLFKEGCMDGYRVITYLTRFPLAKVDLVPTLLGLMKFEHPNIRTLKITNRSIVGGKIQGEWSCGRKQGLVAGDIGMHDKGLYLKIMSRLPESHIKSKQAASVGLMNSYETDVNQVSRNLRNSGFRLVGQSTAGEDVVNLMQDEESNNCILTFEGSDSMDDWGSNLNMNKVGFCGLEARVHEGFREELMMVINSPEFQENIRPKLGKCAALDATGHSLGGAIATLFAACVNGQHGGNDSEYNLMSWNMEAPVLMSSL